MQRVNIALLLLLVYCIASAEGRESRLVRRFQRQFENNLQSDPNLQKYFDISSLSADEAADEFYKQIYAVASPVDANAGELSAVLSSTAIRVNFDRIRHLPLYAGYGISASQLLQLRQRLDRGNVDAYADLYARILKQDIGEYAVENDARSTIKSFVYALADFLKAIGLFTVDDVYIIGVLTANSVYS